VLLQGLRIDMSFPADAPTRRFLESAAIAQIEVAQIENEPGIRRRA
jgi:hypothetical protein